MPFAEIEHWLQQGLCAHVRVEDESASRIWEGFVDEIAIRIGGYSLSLGPVMDIANSVRVEYTRQDTVSSTTNQREQRFTAPAENTQSEQRFGALTKFLSGGTLPTTAANQMRNLYLAEKAWPKGYQTLSIGSGAGDMIDILFKCVGYYARLDVPARWSASGTVNLSDKIITIVGYEKNGLFTGAQLDVATNTTQVPAGEQESCTLWELLVGMLPYSDASFNRYTFGVYENRRVIYAPTPTEIAYVSDLVEGTQQVRTPTGVRLAPWQIKPAQWIFFSSLRGARDISADLRQDPRAAFIETVRFTAPDKLEISGGPADSLPQMMGRFGLAYQE